MFSISAVGVGRVRGRPVLWWQLRPGRGVAAVLDPPPSTPQPQVQVKNSNTLYLSRERSPHADVSEVNFYPVTFDKFWIKMEYTSNNKAHSKYVKTTIK